MDANKIQEESNELVQKLLSADIADLDYVVNQYFESNAAFVTDLVNVHGASKIKKVFKLTSWLRSTPSELVDKPHYDSRSQTIRWSSTISYTSPQVPSNVPLHTQLSGRKASEKWNHVAHLAANNEDGGDGGVKGQRLFVTKLEGKRWDTPVIYRAVPPFIVRPIATFFTLFIVSAVAFYQSHKRLSPLNFVLAAFSEIFNSIWGALLSESGRRQAQADKWRGEKVPQLKEYYNQAYSSALDTASKVQSDLEIRAKNAGIPIDDYKQRAAQAIGDLAENVEARAKAAGIPVEEYKKQAEAAIEDLKRRAADVGQYLEGKAGEAKEGAEKVVGEAQKGTKKAAGEAQKKANEHAGDKKEKRTREDSNRVTQDQPTEHITITGEEADRPEDDRAKEIRAEFAEVPHTPLGGHDPTATNAPSFAAAAAI